MSLPDFVIIGAMKCGTSTLHAQLAAQRGFAMSEPKEPNFFSDDHVYAKGLPWYESLFEGSISGSIKGESSTHYTKLPRFPRTLERLAPVIPEARFIYVMRHPVERLISQYVHHWTQGEIDRPIDEVIWEHAELIPYSQYAMQLAPWLERFGAARILPVFFERLNVDPEQELTRIARFLGMPGEVAWKAEIGAQNVSAERIRRFPGQQWLVDHPLATQLRRSLVPRGLRSQIKARFQMKNRPQLSRDNECRLEEIFNEDLARLGEMLGAPLNCQCYRTTVLDQTLSWTPRLLLHADGTPGRGHPDC